MINGGYDAFDDPYAYPGTSVLRNLLDIRDPEELEAFEVEISTLRSEEPLPGGNFDSEHYRRVHHHLFQDVYAWAGEYRRVQTSKGGNLFCYPEHLSAQMDSLFESTNFRVRFRDLSPQAFTENLASFLGELNAIHPFREGNGRAQLAFIGLVAATFEHPLSFEKLDRAKFLPAMIASYGGNLRPLIMELSHLRSE
jgi:cell filamentation protein